MIPLYSDPDLAQAVYGARGLEGRFRDNAFETLALIAAKQNGALVPTLLGEIPLPTRAMGWWRVSYEKPTQTNLTAARAALEHYTPWARQGDELEQPTPWTRDELRIGFETLGACLTADWSLARKLADTITDPRLQFALYVMIARGSKELIDLQRMVKMRRERHNLSLQTAHTFQDPTVDIILRPNFMKVRINDRLRYLMDRMKGTPREPTLLFQATRLLALEGGIEFAGATAASLFLEPADREQLEAAFAIGNARQGNFREARTHATRVSGPLHLYLSYGYLYAAKLDRLS